MIVFGVGVFGRWLGHQGRALMNGISALIKQIPESLLISSAMEGHRVKTVVYEPESSPSPDTESVHILILDMPAS